MIEITIAADRSVSVNSADAGVEKENDITQLSVITPEAFLHFDKYIEFETADKTKVMSPALGQGALSFAYTLPYQVLAEGLLTAQVSAKSGEIVWKSVIFYLRVKPGVNATEYVVEHATDILQDHEERIADNEKAIGNLEDGKVDKAEGKGLSTNDYTAEDKEKLTGLEILPGKTGNEGKILSIGSEGILAWIAQVTGLPAMGDNSGKFLTTDGIHPIWGRTILNLEDAVSLRVCASPGESKMIQEWRNNENTYYMAAVSPSGTFFSNTGVANGTDYKNAFFNTPTAGPVISRDVADANPALIVNQKNAASTGAIQKWQVNGVDKAYINAYGTFYAPIITTYSGIQCSSGQTYGSLALTTNGPTLTRDRADAVPALAVDLVNAASTGRILDFRFAGVSKAFVNKDGGLSVNSSTITATAADQVSLLIKAVEGQTANLQEWRASDDTVLAKLASTGTLSLYGGITCGSGLYNSAASGNAFISTPTTGPVISRNIADANPALIVDQKNAASTGNIAEFRLAGVTKAKVFSNGNFTCNKLYSGSGMYNPTQDGNSRIVAASNGALISRDIADATTALTVNQVNANSTGNILELKYADALKASVDKDGNISDKNGVIKSAAIMPLIKRIVTTEEVNSFDITADENGNSFSLKRVNLRIQCPAGGNIPVGSTGNAYCRINGITGGYYSPVDGVDSSSAFNIGFIANLYTHLFVDMHVMSGFGLMSRANNARSDGTTRTGSSLIQAGRIDASLTSITRVNFWLSGGTYTFPIGTVVELYGSVD